MNEKGVLVVGGIGVILFTFAFYKVAVFFGLDLQTGWSVLVNMLIFLIIYFIACTFLSEYNVLGNTWYIALAVLWMLMRPALQFFSDKALMIPYGFAPDETMWYADWPFRFAITAILLGGGFFLTKYVKENY